MLIRDLQIPENMWKLRLITPEFIKFAHYCGIAVHIWTINSKDDMKRLLQWNVDGLFTDKPNVLIPLLSNK